jgi:alpha-glucosidase
MIMTVNCIVIALLVGAVVGEWDSVVPTIKNSSAPNPQDVCHGYKADNVVNVPGVGFTATLDLVGRCDVYGVDIGQLGLSVQYQSTNRLAVSIIPTNLKQDNVSFYELPDDELPQGHVDLDAEPDESDLFFEYSNEPSFWFKVTRRSTGDVLFSTEGSRLVFENQFIEFRTQLPEGHNLFGLGETIEDFKIRPGSTRTLYNADIPDHVGANLYGSHPFYMEDRYENGKVQSHGVYLRNAHPQEVLIGEDGLTWRTIGGSIDLYFFSGPNPTEVIRQYQHVVGYPAMQQYWTLGFHQCRWGYATVEEFESVVDRYQQAGIPVETFWSDLDYMDKRRDFTFDPETYPLEKFQGLLNKLHSNGQHYVPLVDAAINVVGDDVDYNTYHSGVHNNVFMKKR